MAKKHKKIDENDFQALDRMARGMTPEKMRPMNPEMERRWKAAKRGRPRKEPATKAVPTMITVEPSLLRQIDAQARKAGLSRSQFLAHAVRRELKLVG